jgi:hypothetical protein
MKFTISRASDSWRPTRLPDPKVNPHESAVWDGEDWIVEVKELRDLLNLGDRLIIDVDCRVDDEAEDIHIEIDDNV